MHTWQTRIRDLRQQGMTLAEIGEAVGLAPSSVSDIDTGDTKSPRGDAAMKLYQLHMERCGKRRAGAGA